MGYAARTVYRRPATWRRCVNRLVAWLAAMGLTPENTVCLEVAGRTTGLARRFAVTMATLGDERYLVSLAGEADWVRNLRAARGRAVIRHRARTEVWAEEIPVVQRGIVLAAYLTRRSLSKSSSAAARDYFGVNTHPSVEALQRIANYFPVFRVTPMGHQSAIPRAGTRQFANDSGPARAPGQSGTPPTCHRWAAFPR